MDSQHWLHPTYRYTPCSLHRLCLLLINVEFDYAALMHTAHGLPPPNSQLTESVQSSQESHTTASASEGDVLEGGDPKIDFTPSSGSTSTVYRPSPRRLPTDPRIRASCTTRIGQHSGRFCRFEGCTGWICLRGMCWDGVSSRGLVGASEEGA